MLEPIRKEKVLTPQYKQHYLPPISADTSNIHKLIEQQYSKTVVLPETHSVEIKNYIQTPQGLIAQPSLNKSMVLTHPPQIFNNQSIIQNNIPNSMIYNPPQYSQFINAYNRSLFSNQSRASYDPSRVRPTI